ncbi:MAG: hypothetical protein IPN60_19940 [Saprospiraceae bacterium]|nr:hypothetical protein [Candidatus Opimibacter skivensis]
MQPVITDQQIFIPTLSSKPDVLVFDRSGHFQRRVEFEFTPDAISSDIHIYPEQNKILVGNSQQKLISVYDLEGLRVDMPLGFSFSVFFLLADIRTDTSSIS